MESNGANPWSLTLSSEDARRQEMARKNTDVRSDLLALLENLQQRVY